MDKPDHEAGSPVPLPQSAHECVITQPEPQLLCRQCQAPLRAPKIANRPPQFCKGNKCRSAWHVDQRRKLKAQAEQEIAEIRTRLDLIADILQELK